LRHRPQGSCRDRSRRQTRQHPRHRHPARFARARPPRLALRGPGRALGRTTSACSVSPRCPAWGRSRRPRSPRSSTMWGASQTNQFTSLINPPAVERGGTRPEVECGVRTGRGRELFHRMHRPPFEPHHAPRPSDAASSSAHRRLKATSSRCRGKHWDDALKMESTTNSAQQKAGCGLKTSWSRPERGRSATPQLHGSVKRIPTSMRGANARILVRQLLLEAGGAVARQVQRPPLPHVSGSRQNESSLQAKPG